MKVPDDISESIEVMYSNLAKKARGWEQPDIPFGLHQINVLLEELGEYQRDVISGCIRQSDELADLVITLLVFARTQGFTIEEFPDDGPDMVVAFGDLAKMYRRWSGRARTPAGTQAVYQAALFALGATTATVRWHGFEEPWGIVREKIQEIVRRGGL